MDWMFTLSELDMLIMVCFYHYAQGAHVNPPPLDLVFYDPRYE